MSAANLLMYIFKRFEFSRQAVIVLGGGGSRCDSASIKRRDKTAACKVQRRFLRGTKSLQLTDGLQPDVREGLMISVRKWRSTRMGWRGEGGCKKLSPLMGPFGTSLRLGRVPEVTDGLSDHRVDGLQLVRLVRGCSHRGRRCGAAPALVRWRMDLCTPAAGPVVGVVLLF